MCCSGPAWKREVVPDHKFDFVDTRDYHSKGFVTRLRYLWVYILVVKAFLVYVLDIYTAITMLASDRWTNSIYDKCANKEEDNCVIVDFTIGKWIFVGCIIFSFLLLGYEATKAKKIIASRDISSAFTNVMANNYYSLRSYDHFCFFCRIENSTKKKDDFAFFIFFTFKGWKRLLLADGPRQSINALTLYSFWRVNGGGFPNINKYWDDDNWVANGLLVSIFFTVLVFLGSLILLIIAAFLYVPLLCYIQGNLKEYCCHKVDKRIAELVKRKVKQRKQKQIELQKKEMAGDYSHYRNKKGELVAKPIPQPTLPNVSIDDESDENSMNMKQQRQHPNEYWGSSQIEYASSVTGGLDYPPMPPFDGYPTFTDKLPHSSHSHSYISHDDNAYQVDDNGSTAHLASGAALLGMGDFSYADSHSSLPGAYGGFVESHDSYAGQIDSLRSH